MHPTAGLCWAACRRTPALADVRAAIAAGADLEFAADLAVAQRVSPLLWRALRAADVDTQDQKWAELLQADAARCQAQARLLLPRLGELVFDPMQAKGLEPLVIKGGALAERYPDPGLRPMDDIDIIVNDADIDRAANTLVAAGWRRIEQTLDHSDEVHFLHPGLPGLPIDLHRTLEHGYDRTNRLTSNQLWAARVPAKLHGAAAFSLPVELELVMLAAHAAKPFHSFNRLIWAVDVSMVITDAEEKAGEVDWDAVARAADAARCRTAVAVALTQAERLGAVSPPELRQLPRSSRRRDALEPVTSYDWPTTPTDSATRWSLRFALADDPLTIANYLVHFVLRSENAAAAAGRVAVFLRGVAGRVYRRSPSR